jgi:hypothetical protein
MGVTPKAEQHGLCENFDGWTESWTPHFLAYSLANYMPKCLTIQTARDAFLYTHSSN